MMRIGPARRAAIVLTALVAAAVLLRPQLASALVTRGDDLSRAGDLSAAMRSYARAAALDPRSGGADRLAFAMLLRRARGDAARAFTIADTALRARPADTALLADRALAAARLRRWRAAERDFAAAAALARDARYAHFAAAMAHRSHDGRAARAHLLDALRIDPHYAPARAVLARFGR